VQNRDNLDGRLKILNLSANRVYEKVEKQLKNTFYSELPTDQSIVFK
jgi:hypothetical protein